MSYHYRTKLLLGVCILVLGGGLLGTLPAALAQDQDEECKPAAPLPQSRCVKDAQCCGGLVCDVHGSPDGFKHCQPGCHIGNQFQASGSLNGQCQSCQPTVSTTGWTNKANGTTCPDDGNACTNDVCSAGVCTHPAKANGTACNDGNACTQTDTCEAGVCTGSNPAAYIANDQCHDAGTCDSASGKCSNPPKADGTACTIGTDGAACDNATCTAGSCQASADATCLVFVTSTTHDGNLGGLAGADQICHDLAAAVHLDGTFKAWLSDSHTNAKDRLTHASVPYVLVNGTQVAANWTDLTDGVLAVPISKTEENKDVTGVLAVWTGTDITGASTGGNCTDWTQNTGSAVAGNPAKADCEWTRISNTGATDRCALDHGSLPPAAMWNCATCCPKPLYCIEQ